MKRLLLMFVIWACASVALVASPPVIAAPNQTGAAAARVTVIKSYQVGCEVINQGVTMTGDGYVRLHGLSNRAVEISDEKAIAGEVINELDMMINQATGSRMAWGTWVIKPSALAKKDHWEGTFTMTVTVAPDGSVTSVVQGVAEGRGILKGKTMFVYGRFVPEKMAEFAPYCGGKPVSNAVEQTIWIIE